jgi:methylated-DNA-[protein]-cysteine S-methyltransferase
MRGDRWQDGVMQDQENTGSEVLFAQTPLGSLEIVTAQLGVRAVRFVEEKQDLEPQSELGRQTLAALHAYFEGDFEAVQELPVDLRGTPFQESVWSALRDIRPGETISYRELAERVGRPRSVRAVGGAVGRNPVAIVVPCHRVIQADGHLGGYAGGVERKAWLLRHEEALHKPDPASPQGLPF